MGRSSFLLIFVVLHCGLLVNSAKILGLFISPSKSHYTLGNVLFKELARRGHEVTMISPYKEKNPPPNSYYRDITLEFEVNEQDKKVDFFSKTFTNPYLVSVLLSYLGSKLLDDTFNQSKVQELLNSGEKFDAVIMDQFIFDGMSYFAHHFGGNHILLSTTFASDWVNPLVGNPSPPSVNAELTMEFSNNMNFLQRVQNTLFYVYSVLNSHLYFFPSQNRIVQKHRPGARPLYDYLYNVSLVLLNGHESFGDPIALVPVMKNVGGFHVSKPKKLPDDLQKFMDDAKDGVIYFSMGSNLQSKDLPIEVRDAILRVFSRVKTKILWKWEDEVLPGQPTNVKLSKWLPQQDILAHPNLKIFITHGGLLSTIEAVYHGVPLMALPVYGDQTANAARAALMGYAISIPFHEFEEAKFEEALNKLLNNPEYKKNAVKRSQIFLDRPMKPMDEAIYWVEYVINHQGAQHLRVASLKLSWYQYLLLDVAAFILLVLGLILYILRLTVRRLCCNKKSQPKVKTN